MPGDRCAAKWCRNVSATGEGFSFFRFPVDSRAAAWIDYANAPELKDASQQQLRKKTLCDVHFTPEMFLKPGPGALGIRRRLKPTAVPTVPVYDPTLRSLVSKAIPSEQSTESMTAAAAALQTSLLATSQLPPTIHADHIYCKPQAALEIRDFPDFFPEQSASRHETMPLDLSPPTTSQEQAPLGAQEPLPTAPTAQSTPRARTRTQVSTPRSFTSRLEGAASIDQIRDFPDFFPEQSASRHETMPLDLSPPTTSQEQAPLGGTGAIANSTNCTENPSSKDQDPEGAHSTFYEEDPALSGRELPPPSNCCKTEKAQETNCNSRAAAF
ncbi:hypothetical protein MTO96_045081 [Rhipicephalus appendiculatus]